MKIIFRPKSIPYILCLLLLILFTLGLFILGISGIIYNNWLFIVIGFLGFIFAILENINILSSKIIFYDDHLYFSSGVFNRYLKNKNTIKEIKYALISNYNYESKIVQIINLKCLNFEEPISIYVKQYSKKQIENILQLLENSVKKTDN